PRASPWLALCVLAVCGADLAMGAGCAEPVDSTDEIVQASSRSDTSLNSGWSFLRADAPGAQAVAFDDHAWSRLDLPHTWNAIDGQDGPSTPYYRGVGWYRRHITLPTNLQGKRLYLQFNGSNIVTDVFVNGAHVGSHKGGFAAFRFDV